MRFESLSLHRYRSGDGNLVSKLNEKKWQYPAPLVVTLSEQCSADGGDCQKTELQPHHRGPVVTIKESEPAILGNAAQHIL